MMLHLCATTELERTYRVNINVIGLNGKPAVRDLRTLLGEWLEFRTATVRRRLEHRLGKVRERLHLLDGLLIAFLNLDEVIPIIRTEDEPRPVLMERFGLSEAQADYVLDTRLRQLARLEEMKIRGEQQALEEERQELEGVLGSTRRLKSLVRRELLADAERYGDDRRSPIVERHGAAAMDETELAPSEALTVVLSERGWVRAAKGYDVDPATLAYRAGDGFLDAVQVRSNQPVVFVDSTGRCYSLQAHALPSARGQGEPLGLHEKVYDVVWGDADERKPGANGKLPPVGDTVDLETATWSNTIGDPELITAWKDPDFDAKQRAFYYARVVEIPTPRWTAYDAVRFGVKPVPGTKMTIAERGYTSPIWYTP